LQANFFKGKPGRSPGTAQGDLQEDAGEEVIVEE